MKKLKVLAGFILAVAVVGLTGCRDSEIAAGAIGVGAGVIIAHGNDNDHHHHHHDRYGRHCRRVDRYGRCYMALEVGTAGNLTSADVFVSTYKSTDERVRHVADRYEISDYAATYIVRAIVLAKQKDVSGITALGLEPADFKTIYDGDKLSNEKIAVLSQKLNMPVDQTADLVTDMTDDVQAANE